MTCNARNVFFWHLAGPTGAGPKAYVFYLRYINTIKTKIQPGLITIQRLRRMCKRLLVQEWLHCSEDFWHYEKIKCESYVTESYSL